MEDNNTLPFDINPTPDNKSIIKIIGVGGGGQNAAAHMYNTGITDVTYLAINSDEQALRDCPIETKLQIGPDGLGCGADPEKGKQYAIDNEEQIRAMLNDGTKMVFITAGMGGGTGTGASPEVARIARDMGILTVGIVTIPFLFEGPRKVLKAYQGINRIKPHCDALLIVNNMKLIKLYEDDTFEVAFKKADNVLADAAKSISDIITKSGNINVDFRDVETTLKDGGVALISSGIGSGQDRMQEAIDEAVKSPLLQENEIGQSKKLLFVIGMSKAHQTNMREMGKLNDFVGNFSNKDDIEVIWGSYFDDDLGEDLKFTILASGFGFANGLVVPTKQTTAAAATPPVTPLETNKPADSTTTGNSAPTETKTPEPVKEQPAAAETNSEPAVQPKPAEPVAATAAAATTATPAATTPATPAAAPVQPKPAEVVKEHETEKANETTKVTETTKATVPVQPEKPKPAPVPINPDHERYMPKSEPVEPATKPEPAQQPVPQAPAPQPQAPAPAPQTSVVETAAPQPQNTTSEADAAIEDLYGRDELNKKYIEDSRKNYISFTMADLNNMALADELENTPAYKRKPADLQRVKNAMPVVMVQATLFG